jgi:hypothetical protein
MKLAYKPLGIILGLIAGKLATSLFEVLWSRIDDEDVPDPTNRDADVSKVLLGAVLQGVVFSGTRAAVDRAGARGWERFFGVWPGETADDSATNGQA